MEFLKTLFVLTSQVQIVFIMAGEYGLFLFASRYLTPGSVWGYDIFLKEILSVEFCSVLG